MKNLMMIKQFSKILMVFVLATVSVVSQAKKETITFIHTDHLGSPIMATNEDGSVKWREDYQPFGKQLTNQDTDNNVGFTGHLDDKSLGLSYMQARWYNPTVGRFMSPDPVMYANTNPIMSFNRYLYVNNNPYKYNDPDGEFLNFVVGAVAGAVQNVVVQNLEMALGVRNEFSWGALASDTALGAATSGLSTVKNVGKLGVTAKKLYDKSKSAKGEGKRKYLDAVQDANGPHTVWKKNNKGEITNHQTFDLNKNPNNPNKWVKGNRTDITGKSEFNKKTKQWVDTPHTHDKSAPGGIRPTKPSELPKQ
jgi:RHS repeat-associated protein